MSCPRPSLLSCIFLWGEIEIESVNLAMSSIYSSVLGCSFTKGFFPGGLLTLHPCSPSLLIFHSVQIALTARNRADHIRSREPGRRISEIGSEKEPRVGPRRVGPQHEFTS